MGSLLDDIDDIIDDGDVIVNCGYEINNTISKDTFKNVKTGGTLRVPAGSTGYDIWMGTGDYYLGKYNWNKVEDFTNKYIK